MSFEIVRAGWLYRQSRYLKKWKRNWFVLYRDGYLKYFDSPDNHTAKEALSMNTCIRIVAGMQVEGVNPPEVYYNRGCLLKLVFNDQNYVLCAETTDDMKAWQITLEEAKQVQRVTARSAAQAQPAHRTMVTTSSYPAQTVNYAYPSQVYYANQQPASSQVYYANQQPASSQVYYANQQPTYVVQGVPNQTTTTVYVRNDPYYNGTTTRSYYWW